MQINNIQSGQSSAIYDVRLAEKVSGKEPAEKGAEKLHGRDEYIPGEEDKPIGLYELSYDEEGNPKIDYDSPEKPEDQPEKKSGGSSDKKPEKSRSESCTANTDKVDREIERLRKRAEQLEQRIASAEGNERERLEKQLKSVQSELSRKDNDSYRRQHTIFS